MRGVVFRPGEVRFVGRHHRQVEFEGKPNQRFLLQTLVVAAVALEFDIKAIAEHIPQAQQPVDDDITLVVVQYTGTATDREGQTNKPSQKEIAA